MVTDPIPKNAKSRNTERWMFVSNAKAADILTTIYRNPNEGVRNLAVSIIDHLAKLGFENYRTILENPPPAGADRSSRLEATVQ